MFPEDFLTGPHSNKTSEFKMSTKNQKRCFWLLPMEKQRKILSELIKPHPCLYDPRDEHFLNYIKKQQKWAEIGIQFNVSGKQIRDRWNFMKVQYVTFKIHESTPLKRSDRRIKKDKPKLIKWPYFNHMSFLDGCFQSIYSNSIRKKTGRHKQGRYNRGKWPKKHTIAFLDELKSIPMLYDRTHPSYWNQKHKSEAYQKISEKMAPLRECDITKKFITRKIKQFKYEYRKAKLRLKASLNKLKPGETPYEPKIWYFSRLGFLDSKGTYKKNQDVTALSDESDLEIEDSGEEFYIDTYLDPIKKFEEVDLGNLDDREEQICEQITLHSKRSRIMECLTNEMENVKTEVRYEEGVDQGRIGLYDHDYARNALQENCSRLLECVSRKMETFSPDKDNGNPEDCNQLTYVLLGEMVETELSAVSEEIYAEAKWKIIHILENASKRSLQEKTKTSLTSTSESSSLPNQFYDWAAKTKATFPSISTPICSKVQTLHIDVFNSNK